MQYLILLKENIGPRRIEVRPTALLYRPIYAIQPRTGWNQKSGSNHNPVKLSG